MNKTPRPPLSQSERLLCGLVLAVILLVGYASLSQYLGTDAKGFRMGDQSLRGTCQRCGAYFVLPPDGPHSPYCPACRTSPAPARMHRPGEGDDIAPPSDSREERAPRPPLP